MSTHKAGTQLMLSSPIAFHLPSRGSYFSPLLLASRRLIPPIAYNTWFTEVGRLGATLRFWLWTWDFLLGRSRYSVASSRRSLRKESVGKRFINRAHDVIIRWHHSPSRRKESETLRNCSRPLCTDQFVTSTPPHPPGGIPRAFYTLHSPGSRAFDFRPLRGWGIWQQAAEGGEFDRSYMWSTCSQTRGKSENVKWFLQTRYCVRDRMADQIWTV